MNEEQRERWLSILGNTKIDKRHYDKVVSYIESYIVNENLYGHISGEIFKKYGESEDKWEDLKENILPLSLKVFEHIDLDKVEFIGYPMDVDTFMVEITGKGNTDANIVNEISQTINDRFNNGYKVKIYKIINAILKKDDKVEVYSRMKFIK